jgi:aryl-alcohol dehydrogenase-like predicted oxidoreductase
MPAFPERITLGRSGLSVSKLGLGASYGAPSSAYIEAFERGVNYFYWGSLRRRAMGEAIRRIARSRREEIVLVLQSYARLPGLLDRSIERALRRLGVDHADVLLLGWHNRAPAPRLLEKARGLVSRGRVGRIALSTHRRSLLPELRDDPSISIWHVRYNAVHRGAEREVFPRLHGRGTAERPGLVTYTTTRWGHLCDPRRTPPGERTPSGTDCYRFVLSRPEVDLCLAGPNDSEQMSQALAALDLGPMADEELAWMRRVGDHIYSGDRTSRIRDGA